MLTATEVLGDFSMLTPAGFVALGASGFAVNVLFCGLGWWALGRKSATTEFRLTAWFFFAVHGLLLATSTVLQPVLGWGDWMTILRPHLATATVRISVALLGAAVMIVMVRRSGASLATVVRSREPSQRVKEARQIVLVGAAAAVVLSLGCGVASPLGATRGVLVGVGAGMGPFVPMFFGTRFVSRTPPGNADPPTKRRWTWLLAAGANTLILWFVFGPGIRL